MRIPDKIAEAIGKVRTQKPSKRDAPISGPVRMLADNTLAYNRQGQTLQFLFDPDQHYVHQEHINMCGEAACCMLMRFAGTAASPPRKNPRGPLEGADWEDHLRAQYPRLKKQGRLRATGGAWTPETLMDQLLAVGPMMVSGNFAKIPVAGWTGHYVVIKGIQGDDVYLFDPWHGPNVSRKLAFINQQIAWSFGCVVHERFESGFFQTAAQ